MKPVYLKFTNSQGKVTKTFTACSLKTGVLDNVFDIAERAEAMQKGGTSVKEVRSFYNDLKAVIVSVYGNQFTYDELNENVETDELMKTFNALCKNITGEMRKN